MFLQIITGTFKLFIRVLFKSKYIEIKNYFAPVLVNVELSQLYFNCTSAYFGISNQADKNVRII